MPFFRQFQVKYFYKISFCSLKSIYSINFSKFQQYVDVFQKKFFNFFKKIGSENKNIGKIMFFITNILKKQVSADLPRRLAEIINKDYFAVFENFVSDLPIVTSVRSKLYV